MTIKELIALINAQEKEFIVQVYCEEESADGKSESD